MTRDLVGEMFAKAKDLRRLAESIEDNARQLRSMQAGAVPSGMLKEGQLVRKPKAWRTADWIERLLERGKKTMGRDDLVGKLVEEKLVGGKDDEQREQYANDAIRRGIMFGYLKEDRSGTVHWVPGIRKSRVTKNL